MAKSVQHSHRALILCCTFGFSNASLYLISFGEFNRLFSICLSLSFLWQIMTFCCSAMDPCATNLRRTLETSDSNSIRSWRLLLVELCSLKALSKWKYIANKI